jgi:hypothetical protein
MNAFRGINGIEAKISAREVGAYIRELSIAVVGIAIALSINSKGKR